jgi:putative transposase
MFSLFAGQLDRTARQEGGEMPRPIDSTPIPLGKLRGWAQSSGRMRGMKMHVVYDPHADAPRILDITDANADDANADDAQIGRAIEIETGATDVFDKGCIPYGWRRAIAAAGSVFATRPKTNRIRRRSPMVESPRTAAPHAGRGNLNPANPP